MNPVASCMICGKRDELAVWIDPNIIIENGNYPYHGVCFSCRNSAQKLIETRKLLKDIIDWLRENESKIEGEFFMDDIVGDAENFLKQNRILERRIK